MNYLKMIFCGHQKTDSNEQVVYRFGMSIRYISFSILIWSFVLIFSAYILRKLEIHEFFVKFLLIWCLIVCFYYILLFFSTVYLVTTQKIYIRSGIFVPKTMTAKHSEIENMEIIQNFLDYWWFNTGTLKFNFSIKNEFPLFMPKVSNPNHIQKKIYESWNLCGNP